MPRPAPQARASVAKFDHAREFQLWTGYDYFNDAYGEGEGFDHELARQHWLENRATIIERYKTWNEECPGRPKRKEPMPWAQTYFEPE